MAVNIPRAPRGIQPVLWHLIYAYSHQLRLDPYAVAAVSIAEGGGRFGAVGDNGSSYGPFQLHRGGALPRTEGARWANSPAGVKYAMTRMAVSGAAGLRGLAAIRSIVTRFERPAVPGPEVQRSLGTYQGWNGSGGSLPAPQGGPVVNWQALQRQQSRSLARTLLQSQNAFKSQLAAQNQSQLVAQVAAQAKARVGAAQTAQQALSAGGSANGSIDTQTLLGVQGKSRLDDLRLAALRRAGIT
jgi:hypothetical protein